MKTSRRALKEVRETRQFGRQIFEVVLLQVLLSLVVREMVPRPFRRVHLRLLLIQEPSKELQVREKVDALLVTVDVRSRYPRLEERRLAQQGSGKTWSL